MTQSASRLNDKVALITGAARGQGAAEARLFAAEGAQVVIADILDDDGKALAAEIGTRAEYVSLDVRDESAWGAVVADIEKKHGKLSVLVNNAGVLHAAPLLETKLEDFERVVAVNQQGCFLGMKVGGASMARSGGGSIINISSSGGIVGVPQAVSYTGSKFAIRGMTKTAAMDLGKHKIRVNSIHPGSIDTPMTRVEGHFDDIMDEFCKKLPIPRVGTPEDIARMALFLASDESSYCSGAEFVVDGGMLAGDTFE
jgi:3alpha(or 20beta)-hydroxysteroid dehydrogenase